MNKLAMSLLATVIINIFVWGQMNGQFIKNGPAWLSSKLSVFLIGAPLGLAFWYATKWSYEYFGFIANLSLYLYVFEYSVFI